MPRLSGAQYYTLACDQKDLAVEGKGPPLFLMIGRFSFFNKPAHQAHMLFPFCVIKLLWICLFFSLFRFHFLLCQMYQCPYCKFTNTDLNRLRMHVMTQHSVQPMLRCPLCQDMLNNKIHLQFHLTHLHSVAPDCVDKLIATVSVSIQSWLWGRLACTND